MLKVDAVLEKPREMGMLVVKSRRRNRTDTANTTVLVFDSEGIARVPNIGDNLTNIRNWILASRGVAELVEVTTPLTFTEPAPAPLPVPAKAVENKPVSVAKPVPVMTPPVVAKSVVPPLVPPYEAPVIEVTEDKIENDDQGVVRRPVGRPKKS